MKIIGVGRNYLDHVRELQNEKPETPVIFMKPETALLRNHQPFYLPEFSQNIQHEIEVVIRIGKEGKHISEKFAHKYIDGIGIGIDFTARDLQNQLKAKGLPWELAKSFDYSAPVSEMIPPSEFPDIQNIEFRLDVNGQTRQKGNTSQMIFSISFLIAHISKYITLKKGDLIFTGTPQGVSSVQIDDHLEGYLENRKLLDIYVK
ncbi:MAG: fumarylacetoacetate hydrolase family protein [Cytophagales bacterium]|nr:fumarylacetoacetate hydrolase family protein [Cytophagales bacterium]MDW8385108.1 fumarylacetoacetate hydrolase family protein [Flammeovirgaceae bacterium]